MLLTFFLSINKIQKLDLKLVQRLDKVWFKLQNSSNLLNIFFLKINYNSLQASYQ